MFTGIVGAVGQVVEWRTGHLAVRSELASGLGLGGSIAVNGVCLTVVEVEGEVFFADVVPETRRRTNLGGLRAGARVNLELPAHREVEGVRATTSEAGEAGRGAHRAGEERERRRIERENGRRAEERDRGPHKAQRVH